MRDILRRKNFLLLIILGGGVVLAGLVLFVIFSWLGKGPEEEIPIGGILPVVSPQFSVNPSTRAGTTTAGLPGGEKAGAPLMVGGEGSGMPIEFGLAPEEANDIFRLYFQPSSFPVSGFGPAGGGFAPGAPAAGGPSVAGPAAVSGSPVSGVYAPAPGQTFLGGSASTSEILKSIGATALTEEEVFNLIYSPAYINSLKVLQDRLMTEGVINAGDKFEFKNEEDIKDFNKILFDSLLSRGLITKEAYDANFKAMKEMIDDVPYEKKLERAMIIKAYQEGKISLSPWPPGVPHTPEEAVEEFKETMNKQGVDVKQYGLEEFLDKEYLSYLKGLTGSVLNAPQKSSAVEREDAKNHPGTDWKKSLAEWLKQYLSFFAGVFNFEKAEAGGGVVCNDIPVTSAECSMEGGYPGVPGPTYYGVPYCWVWNTCYELAAYTWELGCWNRCFFAGFSAWIHDPTMGTCGCG